MRLPHLVRRTLALRIAMLGGIVVGVAGALLWWRLRAPPPSPCEAAFRSGAPGAVVVCRQICERGRDWRAVSQAAHSLLVQEQLDEAKACAETMLEGPRIGDGLRILSNVELRRPKGDWAYARGLAILAFVAHWLTGDEAELARDQHALAQAAWKIGDYDESLEAADEMLRLSQRRGDSGWEASAELARVEPLRRMGALEEAGKALAHALALAREGRQGPAQEAWILLKKGMHEMEVGDAAMAESDLADADAFNQASAVPSQYLLDSVAINQARLLRRREPDRARALLDAVTRRSGSDMSILLQYADLAADRGDLAEAMRLLAEAAGQDPPDADWPWEIARARAELFELRGGIFDELLAERHYRQAIAMVATLRGGARTRSAHLVSSHRGPYEGLVSLLVRANRWREALDVILELDASDMLRATAATAIHGGAPPGPRDPSGADIARSPATVDEVLEAWRSQDLVILLAPAPREIGRPGVERAIRLRLDHGRVTVADVGAAADARRWAMTLFETPDDEAAARALGAIVVPPDSSTETLHVLGIGPLGKIPLPALRDAAGEPIIARRPLARVLALRASGPASAGAGAPAIFADPRGDLLGARLEGVIAATALGAGALLSGAWMLNPATRERLLAVRDAAVLHIATHVVGRGPHRRLLLADGKSKADGEIAPADLISAHVAPRLAILASCGSAAATDEEGWGSFAAALLEAGTSTVLATDRSVDDAAARQILGAFYAQPDWRADPARTLARVQLALSRRPPAPGASAASPRTWAAFSLLQRPPTISATPP